MTTQETIYDIVDRLRHYLEQKETALQEAQRQNTQLSSSLNNERAAHQKAEADALFFQDAHADLVDRLCEAFDCPNPNAIVEHIQALFEGVERQLGETQAALGEAEAHKRQAAGIVKDLQDKMQPVNEYVAELERQIATLCFSASRPIGYTDEVVLVNRTALHALARLAHVEETQALGELTKEATE